MGAAARTLTIGLTGTKQDLGDGFSIIGNRSATFELPEMLSKGQIMAMSRLRNNILRTFLEACNAALRHDRVRAKEISDRIGLNEDNLRANQGKAAGAVVGAVVLLIVLGALLESDSPPPPGPPANAGTG